jgi:hypothetical protein
MRIGSRGKGGDNSFFRFGYLGTCCDHEIFGPVYLIDGMHWNGMNTVEGITTAAIWEPNLRDEQMIFDIEFKGSYGILQSSISPLCVQTYQPTANDRTYLHDGRWVHRRSLSGVPSLLKL